MSPSAKMAVARAEVHRVTFSTCSADALFFFSSRRRHTRCSRDWSSDVCSSDLTSVAPQPGPSADLDKDPTTGQPITIDAEVPAGPGATYLALTLPTLKLPKPKEIGRASCRERV